LKKIRPDGQTISPQGRISIFKFRQTQSASIGIARTAFRYSRADHPV
jgi:hypothetical protein